MRRDEVQRRLEQAGRAPAPEPRLAFTDALERRLRASYGYRQARLEAERELREARDAAALGRPEPRRRPWVLSPVPMGAVALVLVAVTAGALLRPALPSGTGRLELVSVEGAVTVRLPQGDSVAAQPGMTVPDGAVVLTGPSARVVTSSGELGPREIGVVQGRRMRRVERQAESPPPDEPQEQPRAEQRPPRQDRTQPESRPVGVTPPLRPLPGIGSGDGHDTGPSDSATVEPRESPSPDGMSDSEAHAQDPYYNEPIAGGTAEPTEDRPIGLMAKFTPDGVALRWTAFQDPRVAYYVVLRAPGPDRPSWPPAGTTEVIGKSASHDDTFLMDPDRHEDPPVYRVVAIDEQGNELARSRPVTPVRDERPRR